MDNTSFDSIDGPRLSTSEFVPNKRLGSEIRKHKSNKLIKVRPHQHQRNATLDQTPQRSTDMNKSLDVIGMRSGARSFGLSFYRAPNNDYMWKKTPEYKISKAKIGSYLEQQATKSKNLPDPTKYAKLATWESRYRGKFRRQKRVTMSQYYIDKANKTPASNQYKTEKKHKIRGNYKSSIEKYSIIDSIEREKNAIPPPNKYNINLKNSKPRIPITKFYPIKKERFEKIKKDAKPGPCSYETEKAVKTTQWSPPKGVSMKIIKGASRYLDAIVKRKKTVPGVGSYKNYEKGLDMTVRTFRRSKY